MIVNNVWLISAILVCCSVFIVAFALSMAWVIKFYKKFNQEYTVYKTEQAEENQKIMASFKSEPKIAEQKIGELLNESSVVVLSPQPSP